MDGSFKTVVVAEDEYLVRMLTADLLAEAGFEVIEAEHAAAALEILDARSGDIHALCTDVHMPGEMSGVDLAHHTSRHWSWIALIIVSGEARLTAAEMPKGCRFLYKPYDHGHLVQELRKMTA